MFHKPYGFTPRTVAASILFAALLSTPVFAFQPSATGLGQSWPNTMDVSASPHYHVYVFLRDGMRYIQVNDLNGTVRAAVALADNVVLVLPVGLDAQHVSVRQSDIRPAATEDTSVTETVYQDGSTRITATPTSTGAVQVNVVTTSASPATTCTNPADCSGQFVGGG